MLLFCISSSFSITKRGIKLLLFRSDCIIYPLHKDMRDDISRKTMGNMPLRNYLCTVMHLVFELLCFSLVRVNVIYWKVNNLNGYPVPICTCNIQTRKSMLAAVVSRNQQVTFSVMCRENALGN